VGCHYHCTSTTHSYYCNQQAQSNKQQQQCKNVVENEVLKYTAKYTTFHDCDEKYSLIILKQCLVVCRLCPIPYINYSPVSFDLHSVLLQKHFHFLSIFFSGFHTIFYIVSVPPKVMEWLTPLRKALAYFPKKCTSCCQQ